MIVADLMNASMLVITDRQQLDVHPGDSLLDSLSDEADTSRPIIVTARPVDMSCSIPANTNPAAEASRSIATLPCYVCYHRQIKYICSIGTIRRAYNTGTNRGFHSLQ